MEIEIQCKDGVKQIYHINPKHLPKYQENFINFDSERVI